MQFLPAICPTCSGQLQLPQDKESVKCMYCGNNVIVQKAIQAHAGANIQNYLRIAGTALRGGNLPEAYSYFTKVLEFEHDNFEAWIGKATASGFMSNLREPRFPEMLTGFDNAIEFAPADQRERVRNEACASINTVATTTYNSAQRQLMESPAHPNAWPEYLARCEMLIKTLQQAHYYDPSNRQSIEGIIHICSVNIQGIKYVAFVQGKQHTRTHAVTPEYAAQLRSLLEQYGTYMRRFDPNYHVPALNDNKSNCAIATATMGDYDHPDVKILRKFRDKWLLTSRPGRKFVQSYYRYGPWFAVPLRSSPTLRLISRTVLISPAARIIERLSK